MENHENEIAIFAEHCTMAGQSPSQDRIAQSADSDDWSWWPLTNESVRFLREQARAASGGHASYLRRCAETILDAMRCR